MDINKTLDELRQERARIEEAILGLERLAVAGVKRRGRPPLWMAAAKTSSHAPRKRGRPPGSKNKRMEPEQSAVG